MKTRGWLVALVLILPVSAFAAGFTLQQVLSSPFPSNLVAATNKGRVAWVFDTKGVRNVWAADAPKFEAKQVTHYTADDGTPIASLRISPDGKTLVYVRGTETNESGRVADPTSGTESRKQQVWAVDADHGNPRLLGELGCSEEGCEDVELSPDNQNAVWSHQKQLWIAPLSGKTPARQLTDVRGTNSYPRWSPDSQSIAFVSDREDHSYIAIYSFGQTEIKYISPGVDRQILPRWSPDGKKVAFIRLPGLRKRATLIPEKPTQWAIWMGDPISEDGDNLWTSDFSDPNQSFPELTADQSFFFADSERLVFASEQDGRNHLYSLPVAGGDPKLLTPGEFDVEDVAISADGESLLYSSNQNDVDRRHIWRVSIKGGAPQSLTKGETLEWSPVEVAGKVVCLGSTATTPPMPYQVTAQGREMIAAKALPTDFPSKQLVTPKQVIFKSEDGLDIHGQLFVPPGNPTHAPALIFLHGGPVRQMLLGFHYMDYYENAYAMNQYLASQGYIVLAVNYRLGIMYGRAFREAEKASWRGAAEYKDVLAGAKYLQTLPNVDAKRIGLWGGSYGGYLTALGLARNSDLFAAGVDFHGVHDWSVLFPTSAMSNAPDLKDAEKLAFDSSPDASVATWKSPVLLIHGDDDRNVPFGQTVDLVQRLRENHVPFEELIFPDEIHGFLMWKTWIKAYTATNDFFNRTLKEGKPIGTKQ